MRRTQIVLIALMSWLGVTGCEVAPRSKVADEPAGGPVIGYLRTRDQMVTIYSSRNGPHFTVAAVDGEVVESGLSSDELQAKHPGLYDLYQSSMASEGVLDASRFELRRSPTAREGVLDARALDARF